MSRPEENFTPLRRVIVQVQPPSFVQSVASRFQLHGVGVMHQRFSDAVADAGPAVVGAVGVNGFFPVFGVEGGVAD